MISRYSRLLVHELVVVPLRGISTRHAVQDMNMMTAYVTDKRGDGQWWKLLGAAGLKAIEVHHFAYGVADSVTEVKVAV